MRQSREVKAETRATIVERASHLFRKQGIERTSVADVMQAAQKTHGGFYRHFASKEALLSVALDHAFDRMSEMLGDGLSKTDPADVLPAFARFYLSPQMVGDVGGGCPVAALSGEVARGTDEVKQGFAAGTNRVIETLSAALDGPLDTRKIRAAQAFALAAGAVMVARASDPETAELVLEAARTGIAAL